MPGIEQGTVCVFGAGGPVGSVLAPVLAPHYRLRLTDVVAIDEIIARPADPVWPQWRAAPEPPHEWRLVDVTDYGQVLDALEGCDAAVNLAVNREDVERAFAINVVGAFHVAKAAVARGLKRLVHTGVETRAGGFEGDYRYEFAIPDDAPVRPGTGLYPHTKHLGLQIVDAFAEGEGLDVITLMLSRLRPADRRDGRDDDVVQSFSVSWDDLSRAYRAALRAPAMPRPNERFSICAGLPLGKYDTRKAERLLGWKGRDTFERFYTRGDA